MNNQTVDMILSLIASILAFITAVFSLRYVGLEYNLLLTYTPVIVWLGWIFEYYLFNRAREKRLLKDLKDLIRGCNIAYNQRKCNN